MDNVDISSDRKYFLLVCLVLTIVIVTVYHQVWSFEFLKYDDYPYVSGNPNVQAGITIKAVKWAFTTNCAGNWHPLTWLSHMLDWQLFGSDPAGHHITNLIFHIANTLLLFIVLKRMTGALWPSAFVTALFALHPLHVESVAWIAERKDVLSTFFWMLTMWAYICFVSRPKIWRYLLIVVFFALGLMSKPMLVTLPFVLLLLDYWPLERIGSKRSFVYLLIEKIPLFAMVLASSIVTFIVQSEGRTSPSEEGCGFVVRLANAPISYLQYIIKMVWPARLAVFYPHPCRDISFSYAAISAILLLAVTIVILRFAKKRKYLVTGWFWYLGTLVPVIGLVQVGYQAMADRYTYITLTGLFIIIAWGAAELFTKWTSANLSRQARRSSVEPQGKKITLTLLAMLIILAMSISTSLQLGYWRSNVSLFRHALDVTENNYFAHLHIAQFLYSQRRFDEAIEEYQKVLQIEPVNIEALKVLCGILFQQGRDDEAVKCLTGALQIKPKLSEIRFFLATALIDRGKFDQAVKEYEEFLHLYPQDAVGHNDFAVILFQHGESDKAIEHFKRAIQIDPSFTRAKDNLDSALTKLRQ